MSQPEPKSLAPSKVPEVKAFLKCAEELQAMRELFPVVFTKLDELALRYNATLAAAAEATKVQRISCGPFDLYSFTWRTFFRMTIRCPAIQHGAKCAQI